MERSPTNGSDSDSFDEIKMNNTQLFKFLCIFDAQ